MAIAGQIEYKVTVDTSGLKKGLNDAKNEASKFSSTLATWGRTASKAFFGTIAIGAINATGAIAGVAGSAVKAFADYEQLVGGVETLFAETKGEIKEFEKFYGKSWEKLQEEGFTKTSDEVIANAQNAFRTAGMSANEYMETVSAFSASLVQSTKNSWKAMETGDMAVRDMADNANKMGTSIESIQNAYQGFAKQNYTMLDNLKLGYGGTKTEMERLLADAEKLSGQKYDISNLNDVFQAIHVIQEEMGIAGATEQEALGTISGSLNMMKASWQNVLVAVADDTQDFDAVLGGFVDSVGAFAKNIMPTIKVALKGAVKLVNQLAPTIIEALPPLFEALIPAIVEATVGLMNALVENLPSIIQVLLDALPILINGLLQIAQGLLQALPQLLVFFYQMIIGIAKALVEPQNLQLILKAGLTLLIELVKAIPQIIEMFYTALPTLIDSIVGFLTDPSSIKMIIKAGVQLFMGLVKAVPQILGALFSAFGTLIGNLWNRLTGLFKAFAGKFGDAIGSVFKGAINRVLEFIEGFINAPIDIINGFVDTINSAFGSVGVNIGKIGRINLGRMASGGIVPSTAGGRLILAGEGGQDEWVVPESKMASMIEQINERTGGTGTGGITINVYGTFATSEAEQRRVAEQIYSKLQEINKARMGAYL